MTLCPDMFDTLKMHICQKDLCMYKQDIVNFDFTMTFTFRDKNSDTHVEVTYELEDLLQFDKEERIEWQFGVKPFCKEFGEDCDIDMQLGFLPDLQISFMFDPSLENYIAIKLSYPRQESKFFFESALI